MIEQRKGQGLHNVPADASEGTGTMSLTEASELTSELIVRLVQQAAKDVEVTGVMLQIINEQRKAIDAITALKELEW